MAHVSFPEPKSLNILEIGDNTDHMANQKHTLDNPHPEYNKNDNIINPYGHTLYPKMVYPNGITNAGVIVSSIEEEKEVMGSSGLASNEAKDDTKKGSW